MPKQTEKRAKLSKEAQKKLDAANARRRERREAQRKEAAEQLKLEHFVEVAASGGMVSEASKKPRKNGAAARDAVWDTFIRLGGTDAMVEFALKYPKEFFTQIFAKLIPRIAELDTSDSLEELLAQMGNGKIPGMLEHQEILDADFNEVPPIEITPETLQ